jgi:hypothetical protein
MEREYFCLALWIKKGDSKKSRLVKTYFIFLSFLSNCHFIYLQQKQTLALFFYIENNGFLVYNYLKSWNGRRYLSYIDTVSIYNFCVIFL